MRHSAVVCLLSARRQDAAVERLQQILIMQSEGRHTTAHLFNFNMLGASRMVLPREAYLDVGQGR